MVINKIIKSQRLNDQLTSGTLASAGYAQQFGSRLVSAPALTKLNGINAIRMSNLLGRFNIVTGAIGTAYSTRRFYTDVRSGQTPRMRDGADAIVGAVSTVAGIAAMTEITVAGAVLISNPVGWAIGIGAGVYFGARFIYDLNEQ